MFESQLLKMSLSQLEHQSDKLMAYFFATLFTQHPELRAIFPLEMGCQRGRVFTALARYARNCDQPERLAPWLTQLARDHRRYGVTTDHYQPFCQALLEAIRVFSGPGWTPGVKAAWDGALGYICAVMTDEANAARAEPPWWVAEVTGHELRRPDLAVVTLRPGTSPPLCYQPGQHISVQVPSRPRAWREYSVANAPEPDGLVRLHVRAIPGGVVSPVLVHQTRVGDNIIVGRARGSMTADAVGSGAVLCLAGGTGLAPVKAIVEALTSPGRRSRPPEIRVLVGARDEADLYDLPDLRRLQRLCPSLEVLPVVSHPDTGRYPQGTLPDMTASHLSPGTGDVIISGPPAMVAAAAAAAAAARAPGVRIHFDPPEVPAPRRPGGCARPATGPLPGPPPPL